ncbi:MAG: hypothetical protein U1E28_22695 [Beijerinckiaceae bacterium]
MIRIETSEAPAPAVEKRKAPVQLGSAARSETAVSTAPDEPEGPLELKGSAKPITPKKPKAKAEKPAKATKTAKTAKPTKPKAERRDDGLIKGSQGAKAVDLILRPQGASQVEITGALGWAGTRCVPFIKRSAEVAGVTVFLQPVEGQASRYFGARKGEVTERKKAAEAYAAKHGAK